MMNDSLPKLWLDRVLVGEKNECWQWAGPLHSSGYPTAVKDGLNRKTHRHIASLFMAVTGPVHHTCEHKWCVNPLHLSSTSDVSSHRSLHKAEACGVCGSTRRTQRWRHGIRWGHKCMDCHARRERNRHASKRGKL